MNKKLPNNKQSQQEILNYSFQQIRIIPLNFSYKIEIIYKVEDNENENGDDEKEDNNNDGDEKDEEVDTAKKMQRAKIVSFKNAEKLMKNISTIFPFVHAVKLPFSRAEE